MDVYPVVTYGGFINVEEGRGAFNKTKCEGEVKEVFFSSLENIVGGYSRRVREKNRVPIKMPQFKVEECEVEIWGLTGIILEGFLDRILLKNLEEIEEAPK